MYTVERKGRLPTRTNEEGATWIHVVTKEFKIRTRHPADLDMEKLEMFQCPERGNEMSAMFIDYLYNGLSPDGPDANGVWPSPEAQEPRTLEMYRYTGKVIQVMEAEHEQHVQDFRDVPSVKTLRERWQAGDRDARLEVLEDLTIWKGGHLPEGKNGINVDDEPGPRRVAREMHLKQRSNATFMDGHVEGLPLSDKASDKEAYAHWLQRFGVREPARVAAEDDDQY